MKTKLILGVIIAVLIIGGIWWGRKDDSAQKEAIKIGVILPLSGANSEVGNYGKNGLILAAEELNSNSDLKYKYDLIFEDDQYKSEVSVSAITKLINVDLAKYIVAAGGSSNFLAMAPIAEQNKAVLVSSASQSSKVSQAGDYVFRTQTNIEQEAAFFSPVVYEIMGDKKLDLLVINNDYGVDFADKFSAVYRELKGNIGSVYKVDSAQTDFRTDLLKMKNDGAQGVMVAALRKPVALAMKQAKELNLSFKFFSGSPVKVAEFLQVAGDAGNGLIYPYPFDENSQASNQKSYQDKYSQKYGKKSEMVAANSYDTLKTLSYCIEKNGNDSQKVKDCLYSIQNYEGASGTLSFDRNGDVSKSFIIETVKNDQFVPYEK